ncbi:MAG TPA: siderophore-interacting protein [Trebonia sp.]|jgi:NADPH-dependent ferric siderophore reductase|nr:siderophore-interacting protein [Trebonia sp.]
MSETTTTPAGRARPARPQAVLAVRDRKWLSSHTVRVTAGGPGFEALGLNDFTDKYAKLLFVDPGLGLTPPYDLAALRASLPLHQQPVTRTYTLRRVDAERQELAIDFVVHGDEGIAAPWAARTEPGDLLAMSGAGGGYRPDPDCDWHLLVGDESALPAISAAIEALPADARGLAYLETSDQGEYLDATVPAGLQVSWLHRPEPGRQPRLLADALLAGPWPDGRADVFAHGERESMKAVRAALKTRLGDGDRLSLSGYWAAGRTEDVFQSEKRQPIGQI